MRPGKNILFCLMLFAVMLFPATSSADEQEQKTELIKAAVVRYVCIDEYWQSGMLYLRDKPLTMRLIIEGEKFYSKLEDALSFYGTITHMYQIGELKPERAVVTHDFEMGMKKRFEEEPVITTTLTLPPDCTPRYEPLTPRKELMISTIVRTVQRHLEDWVWKGIANYPRNLTFVIADFDIEYPMTYILVEPMNKVYRVSLHDQLDYDGDEYERSGEYPFGEQYDPAKSLIEKIRRHGIRKEITLDVPIACQGD